MNKTKLLEKAKKYRKNIIDLVYFAKAGHPGGSLSCIDILNYLDEYELEYGKDTTRLIFSKGHVTPALYSIFLERGIVSRDEITTFRKINSRLQGHPDRNKIKEIDANTGLLGQGLSIGIGMALGKKLKNDNSKIFVILGDGEMQEGQIWEALMSGSHYKLDNIVAILDYNKLSSKADVNKTMNLEPIRDRILSFGWEIIEIDGHNYDEIANAIEKSKTIKEKPIFIIAHTVKGKGISYMENNPKWHSSAINEEEYKIATKEIEGGM
ncbi:transketolase [Oceanivirga salmonicida]|uniref:transketolase n=1 Tax=Oceanivirga salmonicida TaxID=1769291 RepID=UPI000833C951|nr:transketolase [Oceanivirga salmonicida]